jgi:nucleoid-associated protein YgaU
MGVATKAPVSISTPNSGRLGSLLRVPIDYLLEVYEGSQLKLAVTLPQGPSEYEQKRPSATVITHTLDGVVREHTENHMTEISLKGVSGYAARLGHTRDGGVSFLEGRRILEEFDAFLNEYQKRAAQKGHRTVYMVFRALNERQSFRVEVTEWEWTLAAQGSRFSYEWTLNMEAYGVAPASPLKNIISPVTEALRTAQDYISAGAGAVALGSAALDNVGSELNEVGETLRAVGRIGTALGNVVASADGLVTYVTETLPAIYATEAGRLKEAWLDANELLSPLTDYDPRREAIRRTVAQSAEQTSYRALSTAGLLGVSPATLRSTQADASTADYSERGATDSTARRQVVPYTWRSGDTLQALALRVYGDATRWAEIQRLNNLRSARHWGDGTPLAVGDRLLVPLGANTDASQREGDDLYGVDLALNLATGDLELRDNDVTLTRGARNLEQGLALRLLTAQGESYILPSYGLPLRVGSAALEREVAYLSAQVSDQLKQDGRVRDVPSVEVIIEGDKVAIQATIDPVVGDAVSVVTPYIREA